MNKEVIYFLAGFVFPFVYYRTLLFVATKVFDKPVLRGVTGLKIHHIHLGMLMMAITAMILLYSGKSNFIMGLFGLSLGLMYDEFIPALLMNSNRKDEMIAYRRAFIPTLLLFLVVILVFMLIEIF